MQTSFERGILNMEFLEVATIVTFGSDLKEEKTASDFTNAQALIDYFSEGKILYTREQYFEYDTCETDEALKETVVKQARQYHDATQLYERLQVNPTPTLIKQFEDLMNDSEFGEMLKASIPNDIRLEFDQDGLRTIQTKVITQIPFQKTREKILERVDDAFNQGARFIASVAVTGHMRFAPAASKTFGDGFKKSLIGLH